ncbi:MAG: ABC transporter permease subunit [Coriobacteriales bacterium]|nr:ABC transporter permease subunit [Coriobacteriales bacterium]
MLNRGSLHRRTGASLILKICLVIFFAVVVVLPLVRMLLYMANADIVEVLTSNNFKKATVNTLLVGLITTAITVPLAYLLAWCMERTNLKWKGLWVVLISLPMLIPSISQGTGLIILFGANGVLTNLFNLGGSIYGMHGIVIGEAMYVIPVAFLMLSDILAYEDSTPYEAAQTLGIPRFRQFCAITLPFLRRPMVSVIFAVFSLTITDYGVPLTVGGKVKVLPVLLYEQVIGQLHFAEGSVIGAVLLIPAVIAFLVDLANRDRGSNAFISRGFDTGDNKRRDILALIPCAAIGIFMLLPVLAFVVLTFVTNYPIDMSLTMAHIEKTFRVKGDIYLRNSLIISTAVGFFGVIVAMVTAYLSTRMVSPTSRLLHLLSITCMAIPGMVLGLSYALAFKGTIIYGTLAILIMVNMVHFFASPYLMFYNTMNSLNEHLEAVGLTLGVSRPRIFRDVIMPQCISTILETFSYFFVNSMITISAVVFLSNTFTKPVSLLIAQYEAQSAFLGCTAFVSLMILGCNLVLKAAVFLIKRAINRSN